MTTLGYFRESQPLSRAFIHVNTSCKPDAANKPQLPDPFAVSIRHLPLLPRLRWLFVRYLDKWLGASTS